MHGTMELGQGLEAAMKRQLGLKWERDTMFDYPVTLTPYEGNVPVSFAYLPQAITFCADEEEALLQAVDALETAL